MTHPSAGHPRPRVPGRERGRAVVLLAALLALVSGCGIRATPVPVDAGAAPTRAGCVRPGEPSGEDRGGRTVRVHLVCGARIAPVERRLDLPRGDSAADRLATARGLLDALRSVPSDEEASAGFRTDVPSDLRVQGPRGGDPAEALRLNSPPSKLRSFALAQIVCTYAATSVAADGEQVVLGGPPDTVAPLKKYACDTSMRTRADAAGTAGTPL